MHSNYMANDSPLHLRAEMQDKEENMAIPSREPRVARFEKLAFGMFIHWGLYSQMGQGEWIQHVSNVPMSEYARLKETFTAESFNPRLIAKIAKRAGMKYITLTARHHEGFSLYDTRGLSDFDVMHSPANRDLVAEFVTACREEEIVPMLYHTTLDWYQPGYRNDFDAYLEYLRRSIEILCTHYGEIGGFWFDGNWNKPDADWKLDELYGTIRRLQPEAMIINNTGLKERGELGHPEIDSVTFEQGRPEPMNREGMSKYVSAEMCQTMNDHWGIGNKDLQYKSVGEMIENFCACRKAGANYLLNVGPTGNGEILNIQEAMLETIGKWMEVYGKAVYEGKPCAINGEGANFALEADDGTVYLFIHNLKISGHGDVTVSGGGAGPKTFGGMRRTAASVRWMDNGEELPFRQNTDTGYFRFDASGYPYGTNYVVRVAVVNFS